MTSRSQSIRIREMAKAATTAAGGDFSIHIPTSGKQEPLDALAEAINGIIERGRKEEAEQGRLQEQLIRSEGLIKSLFISNPHPMWVYDLATLAFLAVNDAAQSKYGYSHEEFLSMTIADIRQIEDIPLLMENIAQVTGGLDEAGTWRHCLRDGSVIDVEIISHTITFDGRTAELVLAQDVTSRRRAEARAQQFDRLYAVLSQINQAIVRTKDRDALFEAICGVTVDFGGFRMAWIGLVDEESGLVKPVAHAGQGEDYLEKIRIETGDGVAARGPTGTGLRENRLIICDDIRTDPRMRPWREEALMRGFRSSVAVPFSVKGRVIGALNLYAGEPGLLDEEEQRLLEQIGRDISFALDAIESEYERKRAERQTSEALHYLRTIIERSPIGIITYKATGEAISANESAARIVGGSVEQLMRQNFRQLESWKDSGLLRAAEEAITSWTERQLEIEIISTFGRKVCLACRLIPFGYEDESHLLGLYMDITESRRAAAEREKLEEQLLQAQKMESVGRLAGGVAHDFNNMLTVILGYAEMLRSRLTENDSGLNDLFEIEEAAYRSRDIIRQLLAFSRKQIIAPTILDLNEVILEMRKTLSRLIGEDVDLDFHAAEGLWQVCADRSQIDQILANMSVNSRDAMPYGGKLLIETANVQIDEDYCRQHLEATAGDFVMLAVSDTGIGMDAEILAHLFEPFFTTKEIGRGTGLGLSTVYGIVKQNSGFINVYSEPGHGSSFKIYLPRILETAPAMDPEEDILLIPGAGSVLLVEDNGMVRKMTTTMLTSMGYTVLASSTPSDAVTICAEAQMPMDLLLTDVVMPGMNGRELKEKIQAMLPGIKVLFMSGYTSNVIIHHGVLEEGVHFIQKPFSRNELARKVREALGKD